ncbi:hypothetical protein BsWGS_20604 [Bradybaena similaris]
MQANRFTTSGKTRGTPRDTQLTSTTWPGLLGLLNLAACSDNRAVAFVSVRMGKNKTPGLTEGPGTADVRTRYNRCEAHVQHVRATQDFALINSTPHHVNVLTSESNDSLFMPPSIKELCKWKLDMANYQQTVYSK